jgi:hypothetical protein
MNRQIESPKKLMGGRITHTHKMKPSLEGRSAHEASKEKISVGEGS